MGIRLQEKVVLKSALKTTTMNKKKMSHAILLTLLMGFMVQCKKDNTTYNTFFYTNSPSAESLILFVDDKKVAELPYINQQVTCNNDTLKGKALFLKLNGGKHTIMAKDKNGNINSDGKLKIKSETSLSVSSKIGGLGATGDKDCLIVNVN